MRGEFRRMTITSGPLTLEWRRDHAPEVYRTTVQPCAEYEHERVSGASAESVLAMARRLATAVKSQLTRSQPEHVEVSFAADTDRLTVSVWQLGIDDAPIKSRLSDAFHTRVLAAFRGEPVPAVRPAINVLEQAAQVAAVAEASDRTVVLSYAVGRRGVERSSAPHRLAINVRRSSDWWNVEVEDLGLVDAPTPSSDPRRRMVEQINARTERAAYSYNTRSARWSYSNQPPADIIVAARRFGLPVK